MINQDEDMKMSFRYIFALNCCRGLLDHKSFLNIIALNWSECAHSLIIFLWTILSSVYWIIWSSLSIIVWVYWHGAHKESPVSKQSTIFLFNQVSNLPSGVAILSIHDVGRRLPLFFYLTKRVFSRLGETKILLESPSSNLRELEIPN